jgi:hypothetical protein
MAGADLGAGSRFGGPELLADARGARKDAQMTMAIDAGFFMGDTDRRGAEAEEASSPFSRKRTKKLLSV